MVAFSQGSTILSTRRMDTTSVLPNTDFYGRIVTNFEPPTNWKLVFDKPYNYAVSTEDLRFLTSQCSTKVMVATRHVNQSKLIVAASGPASILELETGWESCSSDNFLRAAKFYNVWWYLVPKHAFGFAPSNKHWIPHAHLLSVMSEYSSRMREATTIQ